MRTITFDPNEPLVIRSYGMMHEAEIARLVLAAVGIPCMLLGDTYGRMGAPIRLAVRRDDAADALAALDENAGEGGGSDDAAPAGRGLPE